MDCEQDRTLDTQLIDRADFLAELSEGNKRATSRETMAIEAKISIREKALRLLNTEPQLCSVLYISISIYFVP